MWKSIVKLIFCKMLNTLFWHKLYNRNLSIFKCISFIIITCILCYDFEYYGYYIYFTTGATKAILSEKIIKWYYFDSNILVWSINKSFIASYELSD